MKRVPFVDFLRNLVSSDYRLSADIANINNKKHPQDCIRYARRKRRPPADYA
jgi:hypothetical protein